MKHIKCKTKEQMKRVIKKLENVRFCFGSPSLDKKYKVIKIAEHERNHRPLAYIEEIDGLSYNKCYLIEVKGLEKA